MSESDNKSVDTDILLLIPCDFFLPIDSSKTNHCSKKYCICMNEHKDIEKDNDRTCIINVSDSEILRFDSTNFLHSRYSLEKVKNHNELNSINQELERLESYLNNECPGNSVIYVNKLSNVINSPTRINLTPKYYQDQQLLHQQQQLQFGEIDKSLNKSNDREKLSEDNTITNAATTNNQAFYKNTLMLTRNDDFVLREIDYYLENNKQYQMKNTSDYIKKHDLSGESQADCEKTIEVLQSELLKTHQKLSIAVEIDKTKDMALTKLNETNTKLIGKIEQLEALVSNIEEKELENQQLQIENQQLCQRNLLIANEVIQTMALVRNFKERSEFLDGKIEQITRSTNEENSTQKQHVNGLEIQLQNNILTEEKLKEEISKLKDANVQLQDDYDEIEKERFNAVWQLETNCISLEVLRQQHLNSIEQLKNEKSRSEQLEQEKCDLVQLITSLTAHEQHLLKNLDSQRTMLKSYFQDKLNQIIQHKCNEYQNQLNRIEQNLKNDAKQRENLIVDRAIKHMELLNEKNEEEFSLTVQKHNEEIALYKIQTEDSSQKINLLHEKLNSYETKRTNIAKRLQNVMETQWQKALDIITSSNSDDALSGNTSCNKNDLMQLNSNKNHFKLMDLKGLDKVNGVVNLIHQSPTKIKNRIFRQLTTNNLISHKIFDDNLQNYIEMLLQKSPRDIDAIVGMLNISKPNNRNSNNKSNNDNCGNSLNNKSVNRTNVQQHSNTYNIKYIEHPPWK